MTGLRAGRKERNGCRLLVALLWAALVFSGICSAQQPRPTQTLTPTVLDGRSSVLVGGSLWPPNTALFQLGAEESREPAFTLRGNATLTLQYAWIDGSNASWSRLAATTDRAAPVAELLLAGLARLNGTGDSRVVATNVTLQTSCERVSQLQRLLCASLSVMALSANQIFPGELEVLHMRTARVDLSNLRITCRTRLDMPTLSLASMADALQQPAWGGSSGAAAPSLVCGAAHVTSWADMAQAAALLQPHANTTFVVLRANLTVSEPSNVGDIPVYRRVVVTSCSMDASNTWVTLGYAQRKATWTLAKTGSIKFHGVTFLSLPLGPHSKFPWSAFGWALWSVNMDRCHPLSVPAQVQVLNSTIVLPPEVMDYMAHWTGEANSPFPERAAAARWYGVDATCNPPMEQPFLLKNAKVMSQRWWLTPNATAFGVNFLNVTFTDRQPARAPPRDAWDVPLQLTHMFDDPYPPFTAIAWVETAEQFVKELQQGVSRYIVLLANISVPASAWPAQGPVTVSTWRDLALSGWPHAARRTYLDLQRQPRRINLLSRLSIRNLAIMNGAQDLQTGRSTWAANLTLLQWTFNYTRSQPLLHLRNVSLIIPPSEFTLLTSSAASSSSPPAPGGTPSSGGAAAAAAAGAANPNSTLRLGQDGTITGSGAPGTFWASTAIMADGCLAVGVVVEDGLVGYNMILDSEKAHALPFPPINITVTLSSGGRGGAAPPSPPRYVYDHDEEAEEAEELRRTIAIAVPVGIAAMVLAAVGTYVWQRRASIAQHQRAQAAQQAAGGKAGGQDRASRSSSDGGSRSSDEDGGGKAAGAAGAAAGSAGAGGHKGRDGGRQKKRWRQRGGGKQLHHGVEDILEGDEEEAGRSSQEDVEAGDGATAPVVLVTTAAAAAAAGAQHPAQPQHAWPCVSGSGAGEPTGARAGAGNPAPTPQDADRSGSGGGPAPGALWEKTRSFAEGRDSGGGAPAARQQRRRAAAKRTSSGSLALYSLPPPPASAAAFASEEVLPNPGAAPLALASAAALAGATTAGATAATAFAMRGSAAQQPQGLFAMSDPAQHRRQSQQQAADGAAYANLEWGSGTTPAATTGGGSSGGGSLRRLPSLGGGAATSTPSSLSASLPHHHLSLSGPGGPQGGGWWSAAGASSQPLLALGAVHEQLPSSRDRGLQGEDGAAALRAARGSGGRRAASRDRDGALGEEGGFADGDLLAPLERRNSAASQRVGSSATFSQDDGQQDSFDLVPEHHEQLLINRMELSKELQASITAPDVASQLKEMVANLQSELGDQEVEITRVIGQGGSGVVYQGVWRGLTVAVKTLVFTVLPMQPMSRRQHRAMTEAALCRTLQHPHIVATYAYDLHTLMAVGGAAGGGANGSSSHSAGAAASSRAPGGDVSSAQGQVARAASGGQAMEFKLFIIQEFCDSGTLKAAIDDGKLHDLSSGAPRPVMSHILQLATDIAAGMSHVHSRRVVHGDLTPANVLLKSTPSTVSGLQAKVADFGLSWKLASGQEHVSNARQGTGFYIAPEVLHVGIMSKAADVFSFGMVLHEMYHGQPYWRRCDHAAAATAALRLPGVEQLSWSPSCPQDFKDLVCSCLSSDLQARPSFFQIVEQLLAMQRRLYAAEDHAEATAAAAASAGHPPCAAAAPHAAPRSSSFSSAAAPVGAHWGGASASSGAFAESHSSAGAAQHAQAPPGATAAPAAAWAAAPPHPSPGARAGPERQSAVTTGGVVSGSGAAAAAGAGAAGLGGLVGPHRSLSCSLDGRVGPSAVPVMGGAKRAAVGPNPTLSGSARQPTTGMLSERDIKAMWRSMRLMSSSGSGAAAAGTMQWAPQEVEGAEAWAREEAEHEQAPAGGAGSRAQQQSGVPPRLPVRASVDLGAVLAGSASVGGRARSPPTPSTPNLPPLNRR